MGEVQLKKKVINIWGFFFFFFFLQTLQMSFSVIVQEKERSFTRIQRKFPLVIMMSCPWFKASVLYILFLFFCFDVLQIVHILNWGIFLLVLCNVCSK